MHQRCGKTRNEGHDQYEDAENVFTQTQTLIPTVDLPYAFSLPPSLPLCITHARTTARANKTLAHLHENARVISRTRTCTITCTVPAALAPLLVPYPPNYWMRCSTGKRSISTITGRLLKCSVHGEPRPRLLPTGSRRRCCLLQVKARAHLQTWQRGSKLSGWLLQHVRNRSSSRSSLHTLGCLRCSILLMTH